MPATVISSSEEDTFALGMGLAHILEKGSIVALNGALGAGKTCLAKGIASGLGIEEELTSPSYAIIAEYDACISGEKIKFYHIDAYRLGGNEDFAELGGEEIVFGSGVSVIEWSERIPYFIPSLALGVDLKILDDDKRQIKIYRKT